MAVFFTLANTSVRGGLAEASVSSAQHLPLFAAHKPARGLASYRRSLQRCGERGRRCTCRYVPAVPLAFASAA